MNTLKDLEQFILELAPQHYPTNDAPKTYEALLEYEQDLKYGKPIPVYNGGCDKTIWSSPKVNHAFRAYHDAVHIIHGYDFSLYGELCTAKKHVMHAKTYFGSDQFANVLWCEVAGQVLYFNVFDGEFVDNQKEFVFNLLACGVHHKQDINETKEIIRSIGRI